MSTAEQSQTIAIPTPDEIRKLIAHAETVINGLTFPGSVEGAIIDDYPIGGSQRGQCRLRVDFNKSKGYRTSRETTNRQGRWCSPKKSIYHTLPSFVVTGDEISQGHEVAWLAFSTTLIYLSHANYSSDVVARWPHPCSAPRREDHHYGFQTHTMNGEKVGESHHILKADPAELCDAWDVWVDGLKSLMALARSKEPQLYGQEQNHRVHRKTI